MDKVNLFDFEKSMLGLNNLKKMFPIEQLASSNNKSFQQ